MITLTLRQWLFVGLAASLVGAGWYHRDLLVKKEELKVALGQVTDLEDRSARYDRAVAAKLREEAEIDAAVARALERNQEYARNEPIYRDYLDRPLSAESRRLYRDAAKAIEAAGRASADDSGGAADEEDR